MAYNQKLADRIRERLVDVKKIKEKEMMGGLTFMVNDKMCVGIIKDEMMCRIDPEVQDLALSKIWLQDNGFHRPSDERIRNGGRNRHEIKEGLRLLDRALS